MHIPALRQLRLRRLGAQFIVNRQRHSDRLGRHDRDEEGPDGSIEIAPGNPLTGSGPMRDPVALAQVVRHNTPPTPLVIAHRHPLATAATDDESLQQDRPLPQRTEPLWCIGLTVCRELRELSLNSSQVM